MAMNITESTLSDSYVYKMLDADKKVMSTRIAQMMKSATQITPDMIEAQLLSIRTTRLSPMWETVLDAYKTGSILLLYDKTINIPTCLPFVVIKQGNSYKSIVILNAFGNMNKDGNVFNMNFKDLYVIMETSYVAQRYYFRPQTLTHNSGLMRLCTMIYTEMIRRVLSRDYSLVTNEVLLSQIMYVASRFFIERVWSLDSPATAHNYAVTMAGGVTTDISILQQQYESQGIENLENLVEFLSTLNPRMRTLKKNFFMQRWINTFGSAATLGIDCLPYFLFIISCTMLGSFLITQPIMSDICKNSRGINSDRYYPELVRVV